MKHIKKFEKFIINESVKIVFNKSYSDGWGENIINRLEREFNVDFTVIDYNDKDELIVEIEGEDEESCILMMDHTGIMNTTSSDVDIQ